MTTTSQVLVACSEDMTHLEHLLKDLNLGVNIETTGGNTLAFLRENTPDLIIMDARLPEITGTSIAYRVKKVKRLKHIPIILMVDALDSKLRVEAELSGVEQVALKPFRFAPMRGMVNNLLNLPKKRASEKKEPEPEFSLLLN